jgi:hypothetical protein
MGGAPDGGERQGAASVHLSPSSNLHREREKNIQFAAARCISN